MCTGHSSEAVVASIATYILDFERCCKHLRDIATPRLQPDYTVILSELQTSGSINWLLIGFLDVGIALKN